MNDELEQHPYCVWCAIARLTGLDDYHNDCLGRGPTGYRWCQCVCPWLKKGTDENR